VLGPDTAGGAQALVRVGRRHANVDHRDVGLMRADLAEQILAVAGLAGDLEARLLQQPRDSLAQQHRILGDHHADGIVLRARRCPARTLDGSLGHNPTLRNRASRRIGDLAGS
jgi:hypothetical protein